MQIEQATKGSETQFAIAGAFPFRFMMTLDTADGASGSWEVEVTKTKVVESYTVWTDDPESETQTATVEIAMEAGLFTLEISGDLWRDIEGFVGCDDFYRLVARLGDQITLESVDLLISGSSDDFDVNAVMKPVLATISGAADEQRAEIRAAEIIGHVLSWCQSVADLNHKKVIEIAHQRAFASPPLQLREYAIGSDDIGEPNFFFVLATEAEFARLNEITLANKHMPTSRLLASGVALYPEDKTILTMQGALAVMRDEDFLIPPTSDARDDQIRF